MTAYPIVTAPDPILKQVSVPVERVDDAIRQLMDDMLDSMYEAGGIGLAAVQIGIPKRVIVMDLARDDEPPDRRYFVNPEILETVEQTCPNDEGCLSVPDVYDTVERPQRAKIRYLNYQGEQITEWAEGLYAVCIQHEMDHLQGILFIDHLSRLKRERALDKLRKARRREVSA